MVWALIIGFIIIILVILALPFALRAMVNNALRKMEGYTVQIERFQINLFKSKINLQGISIVEDSEADMDNPLLLVDTIAIGFKWNQLLKKILDMNIVVDKPKVLLIAKEPTSSENEALNDSQLPSLKNSIEKLTAFKIHVDVRDGTMRYLNAHSKLDIISSELNFVIHDFSNRPDLSQSCRMVGKGILYEGYVAVNATLLPLAPTLTADLNLELKSINLVLLNDLLRKYGKVDLTNGTLDLYAEVAVADNSFKGYIKPLLKDLKFISAEDRDDSFFRKIWERAVAGFYNLLENRRNNQVATKIPIEGRLDDPHVRVGAAIVSLLRNAFIKALIPTLENVINFRSTWNRDETKHKTG